MTVPEATGRDESLPRELHELVEEVSALRGEVRRLGTALPRDEAAGWDDERPPASHAWIPALGPPRRSAVRLPRLPFELGFLAVAAVLAGLADLRPVEIAVAMGAAWVVVAAAEWAGSRGDRLRARLLLAQPLTAPPPAPAHPDPAWFTPPVEHTLLGSAAEQSTAITTLPPADDAEATAEHPPGG
jgi:hypothetical protein